MNKNENGLIAHYTIFKESGMSAEQVFEKAIIDGIEGFDAIKIIMFVFEISFADAREVFFEYAKTHDVFKPKKSKINRDQT